MQDGHIAPRRRARRAVKRSRTIRFDLSEREFGEIQAAAEQAGLAKGAFVAQAALAVARNPAADLNSGAYAKNFRYLRGRG